MATLAPQPDKPFAHWRDDLPGDALAHIPGDKGLPVVGQTFRLLADPWFRAATDRPFRPSV